jgi:N-methylhydantoinase A
MEAEAFDSVTPGAPGAAFDVTREVDLRYVGQGHELTVPVPLGSIGDSEVGSMITAFEKLYRAHYGLIIPDMVVEALTWSVTVASKVEPSDTVTINEAGGATGKPIGTRALFEPIRGESAEIPEFWRNNLAAGQTIDGPVFIAEDDTTTVVDRGWRVSVDARGYLNLERTEAV